MSVYYITHGFRGGGGGGDLCTDLIHQALSKQTNVTHQGSMSITYKEFVKFMLIEYVIVLIVIDSFGQHQSEKYIL